MTLRVLWSRLRKRNKKDYRQFQFCIVFAMMLVSSYLMMLYSPLVKSAMPEGGDTGKMAYLNLGIAVIGCTMFVWYATRRFLRYKSREIGIFMALGAEKGMLSGALFAEMSSMIGIYALEGILCGGVVAVVVGNVMEFVTREVNEVPFGFSVMSIVGALIYGVLLLILAMVLTRQAMKRTNIMDVINEQRKQEPMRKSVTKRYLISGVVLTVSGIFLGYFLKIIVAETMGKILGGWTNLFYLLTVIGVYQLLVYSISCHQRGRNPQKYYNNLLNYGMLKFQGSSIVKNMLVITLLVVGGLYSISYVPTMTGSQTATEAAYQDDFSYRYLNDAKEPTEEKIFEMAEKHGVEIENYRETEYACIVGDGVERNSDDDGNITEDVYETYSEYDCISATNYEKLTKIKLDVPQGKYYLIQPKNAVETTWFSFDDMSALYDASGEKTELSYAGNTEYTSLILTPNNGIGADARFVLNDNDYEKLRQGLPEEKTGTQVLFNTKESDKEIGFATELYKEFALGMSEGMDVMDYYNPQAGTWSKDSNPEDLTGAIVDPKTPAKGTDWKYRPIFTPLLDQQTILGNAVKFMMFIYVAVICFVSVGIIGYTRSQDVGSSNAQIFEDIKKLGADKAYRKWLLRKQISKVYVLPTIIGIVITMVYQFMILWGNDGAFLDYEVKIMLIGLATSVAAVIYQYVLYRKSVMTVGKALGVH